MKPLFAVILASASSLAFAAEPTTLVIPKVTKPLVEPVENDPLQAGYDKMWSEYEQAVKKAADTVAAALDNQVAKAADSGELDLVEIWEARKKQFAESGKLEWDTSPKASLEWKKKYPKIPYPREFSETARSASSSVASASEKLEEGYAELVKSYTKTKNVPRAKELRAESEAMLAGHSSNGKAEVIDLMKKVRITPSSKWTLKNGILTGNRQYLAVQNPIDGDYDLTAEIFFRPASPIDRLGVNLVLPGLGQERRVSILNHGIPRRTTVVWTPDRREEWGKGTSTTRTIDENLLAPKTWYTVVVEIRRKDNQVTILLDGKELLKAPLFAGSAVTPEAKICADNTIDILVRRWEITPVP